MKFNEFDVVKLLRNCGEINEGEKGVIVMVYDNPEEAYEVEVLDEKGNTKAICTLKPDNLELMSK